MKRLAIVLALSLLLIGCYSHISQVKEKWGPPAKVEYKRDTITYFYYFHKGKATVYHGDYLSSGSVTAGWITVEIITDRSGKILKKRKYWKQPKVEP